jgi:hypothetical protein
MQKSWRSEKRSRPEVQGAHALVKWHAQAATYLIVRIIYFLYNIMDRYPAQYYTPNVVP